jgi:peptidase inhibitor family I36
MTRTSCAIILGLLAVTGASCSDDDNNPTAPTDVVVIYADTNFRGNSRAMLGNAPNLDDLPGCGGAGADWDDCISSIRVPSGWEVAVFDHDDYTGDSATFRADVPDLHQVPGPCGNDWDDCISSIQVRQR